MMMMTTMKKTTVTKTTIKKIIPTKTITKRTTKTMKKKTINFSKSNFVFSHLKFLDRGENFWTPKFYLVSMVLSHTSRSCVFSLWSETKTPHTGDHSFSWPVQILAVIPK